MAEIFPVTGVVGVLDGASGRLEKLESCLQGSPTGRPDGVEVRADLFDSLEEALGAVRRLSPQLPVLFTLRLAREGGRYRGEDLARVSAYHSALAAGAVLLDAEGDSDAVRELVRSGAPVVASHHDFERTPPAAELAQATARLEATGSLAVKLVPTARTPADGVAMLNWTRSAPRGGPRRVGFAMGEVGLFSRVLSISRGAPYTYAALGGAVAPGQPGVLELKSLYRAVSLRASSRVLGVTGNPVAHSLSPWLHNRALAARGVDAVYLPFRCEKLSELLEVAPAVGLCGLSVTIPFKEPALQAAAACDDRSRSCGASNTLLLEPGQGPRAFNTDFDGVLEPLRRRGIGTAGLSVGIVGNGGAARAAARALKDGGARVALYWRNRERGEPVAEELGVCSAPLDGARRGAHRLWINATPLGLHAGDPSPLPPEVFDSGTVAFDMIYEPAETPFLAAAASEGAATIPGREMLICQGLVQLRLFTGIEATYEELEAAFLEGKATRSAS